MGVVAVQIMNQQPEEALAQDSAARAESVFTNMLAAETTADLRQVAVEAKESQDPIDEMIPLLASGNDTASTLVAYQDIFAGVAVLDTIDGDHLGVWQDAKSAVQTGTRGFPVDYEDLNGISSLSASALESADDLVTDAESTMSTWRNQVKRVERANRSTESERQALSTFRAALMDVHADYASLRTSTSEVEKRIDGGMSDFSDVKDYFQEGIGERQNLLFRLDKLAVPTGMDAATSQLRSILIQGEETMRNVSDAMETAWECSVDAEFSCLLSDSRWDTYQSSSRKIGPEMDSMSSRLGGDYDRRMSELQGRPTPQKPAV